jgi:SAM-dependent methyltransferase
MNTIKDTVAGLVNAAMIQTILSNARDPEQASKVKLRPVRLKDELFIQETVYVGKKVLHANLTIEEAIEHICKYLEEDFKQGLIQTETAECTILISKKGKATIKTKQKQAAIKADLSHNRQKKYILDEGDKIPFLIDLGIMNLEGKVVKAKYDKFRQINKYLEFIRDIIPKLPKDRTIRIIDFGCGKSYLTFAMYYYLHDMQALPIEVIGLDLKEDVIAHCNELAVRYGFANLHFEMGDIAQFTGADSVDMVVTLHACDTATDYAIEKAVKWGASVILTVPCCQHEVNAQINSEFLKPALKYGLIKERMSALLTDAIRANMLESLGYDTQILEFIDMEHTPKNILIRATRKSGMRPKGNAVDQKVLEQFTKELGVRTTLQQIFSDGGNE